MPGQLSVKLGDQRLSHAKYSIFIQIGTVVWKDVGDDGLEPGSADNEMDMRRAIGMSAVLRQEFRNRAVIRYQVEAWFCRAVPVASIGLGGKDPAKVLVGLYVLLLDIVESILVGLPHVDGGAWNWLPIQISHTTSGD
jgi:hypothetical protein